MVDGWTGTWYPEDDYLSYPEEKLCDMDRLYVKLKKLYPEYEPKTSWENILYMIFGVCAEDEYCSFELDESSGDLKPLKNIYTIFSENNEDNWHWLGEYSTLGQAKDILDEIETFYTDKMANRLIYQMPSDDGVIWEERHD